MSGSTIAPSAMGVRKLPAELVDMIIDYLYDDSDALENCSLVCRTWLCASRFQLFRTTTLQQCSRLLSLNKSLGRYVYEFRLGSAHSSRRDPIFAHPFLLSQGLRNMSNLQVLKLHGTHFCVDPIPSKPCVPPLVGKLKYLELENVGCLAELPSDILHVLDLFSEIETVKLGTVISKVNKIEGTPLIKQYSCPRYKLALRVRIRSLIVDTQLPFLWCYLLRNSSAVTDLTQLTIKCKTVADAIGFQALVGRVGHKLTDLSIDLVSVIMQSSISQISSLWSTETFSTCSQLETLKVIGYIAGSQAEDVDINGYFWRHLLRIISYIPPSLKNLKLIINSPNKLLEALQDPFGLPWFHLEKTLSQFVGIRTVTLVADVKSIGKDFEECQHLIQGHLKDLHSRGRLHFVSHTSLSQE